VDAALVKPLPYRNLKRLVGVSETTASIPKSSLLRSRDSADPLSGFQSGAGQLLRPVGSDDTIGKCLNWQPLPD
jgi:hypothetical protein